MVENIATGNVYKGGVSLLDAVVLAGGSILSRQIMGRIIGNNSWLSAGAKIGGALAVNFMAKGKISNYVSGALLIDGATDVANILLNMVGVGAKNGAVKKADVL